MEFLSPLGLTQVEFAEHLGVPIQRLNEIIRGKRGVTPATAWLLSQALGTSPEFWLNLQAGHDLAKSRTSRAVAKVTPLRRRLLERQRVVFAKRTNPARAVSSSRPGSPRQRKRRPVPAPESTARG